MNQDQAQWYIDMAKALKARDHAIRMVARWTQQLADAEEAVQKLSAANSEHVPENSPETDSRVRTFTVD